MIHLKILLTGDFNIPMIDANGINVNLSLLETIFGLDKLVTPTHAGNIFNLIFITSSKYFRSQNCVLQVTELISDTQYSFITGATYI